MIYPANIPSTSTSYNTPTFNFSALKTKFSTTKSTASSNSFHSNSDLFSFFNSSFVIPLALTIFLSNPLLLTAHPLFPSLPLLPLPWINTSTHRKHVCILFHLPFPPHTFRPRILRLLRLPLHTPHFPFVPVPSQRYTSPYPLK